MRKTRYTILSLALLSLAFIACSDDKTPQELMKEESRAIERYLDRNHIDVLKKYPTDRPFGEKEYFKTPEGLYIQVVDSGNGNRAKAGEKLLVRYEYYLDVKKHVGGDDSVSEYASSQPYELDYGVAATYSGQACVGWTLPMQYMGEGAIVNLIIPSSIGSSADNTNYRAVFYKNLIYRFQPK